MIELDEARVLERIAPVDIRAVGRAAVEGIEEFGFRRGEAVAHVWELVVDEAGVETGDEGAGEDGSEDEESEGGDATPEGTYNWVAEFTGDEFESGCGIAQPAGFAKNGEPCEEHGRVACEGGAEMCG